MILEYILNLFSDRYPFVNGEFIPPKTHAAPEPKMILDVTKRIETSVVVSKVSKNKKAMARARAAKSKQKRGY